MADDLDLVRPSRRTLAMMKIKALGLPRLNHFNVSAQLAIVIARDDNRFAMRCQISQKLRGFQSRGLLVNKVAQNDQTPRLVFINQLHQALGDRSHPPHRHETTSHALTEFVAKMQVGNGEPPLRLVEKREAAIEQDFIGDKRLIRA